MKYLSAEELAEKRINKRGAAPDTLLKVLKAEKRAEPKAGSTTKYKSS